MFDGRPGLVQPRVLVVDGRACEVVDTRLAGDQCAINLALGDVLLLSLGIHAVAFDGPVFQLALLNELCHRILALRFHAIFLVNGHGA